MRFPSRLSRRRSLKVTPTARHKRLTVVPRETNQRRAAQPESDPSDTEPPPWPARQVGGVAPGWTGPGGAVKASDRGPWNTRRKGAGGSGGAAQRTGADLPGRLIITGPPPAEIGDLGIRHGQVAGELAEHDGVKRE